MHQELAWKARQELPVLARKLVMPTAGINSGATACDKVAIFTLIDPRHVGPEFEISEWAAEVESRNLTISLSGDVAFAEAPVCMSGNETRGRMKRAVLYTRIHVVRAPDRRLAQGS
jgi:hypothetical protein